MSFPCTRCGACCRAIGALPEMREYDLGNGVCKHLTPDNECAIYDERPALCRIDLLRPPAFTEKHWFDLNIEACRKLRLHVYGQE